GHFVLNVMRLAVALVSVYLAGVLVYQLAERPSYALRARLREKLRPAGRPSIPMTHPGWQIQAPAYRALAASAASLLALAISLTFGLNRPLRKAWSNWFDDGRELLLYQPAGGWWMRELLSTGWTSVAAGQGEGYLPVPGDYDGDSKRDLASYQRTPGFWGVPRSSGRVGLRSIEGPAGPDRL